MTHPTSTELVLLRCVADDIRDQFGARGYRVDKAVGLDEAFGSASRSALTRDLVKNAAAMSASQHGLQFGRSNGGALEFRHLEGVFDRRYRLRRGVRLADRSLRVSASAQSALVPSDAEESGQESLLVLDQWVFVWTSRDDEIEDIAIAEVRGYEPGSPGYLILGPEIALGGGQPGGGGFVPTDEDLEGFEDDEDLGDDFGASA